MATPLKDYYSQAYLRWVAHCVGNEISMPETAFYDFVTAPPWETFALKERMARLTQALDEFFPANYRQAIKHLKKLLPQISGGVHQYDDLLAMFVPDFVLCRGRDNLKTSLQALAYFTAHGTSSELAVRPFIMDHQTQVMAKMLEWAHHKNHHVRRFASEGCRPRLPWAMALPAFKQDPSLILPILEVLKQDDSRYVQKSVANNLNDISKDHPDIVIAFASKWSGTHPNTDWILKQACRTLLKKGVPEVLALFGSTPIQLSHPKLHLPSKHIHFGRELQFEFDAQIRATLPKTLRVEYAIDFMKANGKTSRKIFKVLEQPPKSHTVSFSKSHKFIPFTTRKHYPGEHGIAIIVNGFEVANAKFDLVM